MLNEKSGYYICNGVKFSSKINALIYSKTVNLPVTWYFYDELFSSYNWSIEPDVTLDELYGRRARELREQYDYLILSYSGGSDTHNIVESFIRQGIHIDEIVTNHISYVDKTYSILDKSVTNAENFLAEHELQTIPRLKEISQKMPKTKITVLDMTEKLFESFDQFNEVEWTLGRNDHLTPIWTTRFNLFYFKELRKQFDKNLKIGVMLGIDKPITFIRNGMFHVEFTDTALNLIQIDSFNDDYTNLFVDPFYWSPSCLELLCKQVHTVKNWLEVNPGQHKYWTYTKDNIGQGHIMHRQYKEPITRTLIYTTWNKDWFQVARPTKKWNTQLDAWFKQDPNFIKENENWKKGLEYIASIIPEYVVYNDNIPDGIITFKKQYQIAPMMGLAMSV